MVTTHLPLVGQAREPAGPGQHAQQRHFRQADRGRPIVDQQNLVTRKRQLISPTRRRPVAGGDELQAGIPARVLDAVAGLVGELAEVHLPGVAGEAEHEDVRARAEDAVLQARDDDGAHLRVLEADAIERIAQFDVDAEVVAVELQLVAGADAAVLGDVHGEPGHLAFDAQLPVPVRRRLGAEVNAGGRHLGSPALCCINR